MGERSEIKALDIWGVMGIHAHTKEMVARTDYFYAGVVGIDCYTHAGLGAGAVYLYVVLNFTSS